MRQPDRIIRLRTVLARTSLSRSTIYRKIAEGTFPPQLKISANGAGWHESIPSRPFWLRLVLIGNVARPAAAGRAMSRDERKPNPSSKRNQPLFI